MKERIRSKCMLLTLPVILFAILAGVRVMASSTAEDIITYRGRSLRIDQVAEGNLTGAEKTSLRFGYTVKLPEGAEPNGTDWISWEYTMDGKDPATVPGSIKTVTVKDSVENTDGSTTANIVIKGVPSDYYRRVFYVQMTVKYTENGENKEVTESVWHSTTIKDVTDAIIEAEQEQGYDPNYQKDKAYAEGLKTEIGTYAAMTGDRMYDTLSDAIGAAKDNTSVSVLKNTAGEKAITIDKSVTLTNMDGENVSVRGTGDEPIITVAETGALTIDGSGITIFGNIKAEGNITLTVGIVKGEVALSDKNGGITLSAGEKAKIIANDDGSGGLTGSHEENETRTAPLMTLQDRSSEYPLPQIHISETKADTVVMDIPEELMVSGGIQSAKKDRLTCATDTQLMWGPYEAKQKTVTVQDATAHIHCACGKNVMPIAHCGTSHWDVEYTELKSNTAAGAGGNYYLSGDITIGSVGTTSGYYDMRYATKDLNLCLNGHTLTGGGGKRIINAAQNSANNVVYMLNVTGVCSVTENASTANVGDVSIQYGTLKKTGSANSSKTGLGGCIYAASAVAEKVRLHHVYLDGSSSECNTTGAGGALYNGNGSKELRCIVNCLISNTQGTCPGAYNKNNGALPYTSGDTIKLYEFPQQ